MQRTSILLPENLKVRAEAQARRQGISLGELIRRQLGKVARPKSKKKKKKSLRDDPAFQFYLKKQSELPPVSDTATDVAVNHDKYLAEAMDEEMKRWRRR